MGGVKALWEGDTCVEEVPEMRTKGKDCTRLFLSCHKMTDLERLREFITFKTITAKVNQSWGI